MWWVLVFFSFGLFFFWCLGGGLGGGLGLGFCVVVGLGLGFGFVFGVFFFKPVILLALTQQRSKGRRKLHVSEQSRLL